MRYKKSKRLEKIIAESLLEIRRKTQPLKVEDYFNLQALTKRQVMYMATDIRAHIFHHPYDSSIGEEGGILQEDTSSVLSINELWVELEKLGFKDWQIKYEQGSNDVHIVMLYADVEKNTSIIINAMNSFGWICARKSEPVYYYSIPVRVMEFDPKEQPSMTNQARKYQYLYHITPIQNANSILLKGIEARSENEMFSYEAKSHLLKGDIPKRELEMFGWRLWNKKSSIRDGRYIVFRINLDKVPNNIEFYGDGRYDYGLFTKETIPPAALDVFGAITYTDKWNYRGESLNIFVPNSTMAP